MSLLHWRGRTNKKAFLERCRRAVLEKFPQAQVEPGGEIELNVVFPNGTRNNVYLGRAYAEFCETPRDFDEIAARYLRFVAASVESTPVDPAKLVPMIKDRAWVRSLEDPAASWIEDYNEQLVVAYAEYDTGFHYRSVTEIDKLGVARDELRQRALANLATLSAQREILESTVPRLVNVGGNFEASQILLDDFWNEAGRPPLIAVPDRDTLAMSSDDSPRAVWWLAEAAARLARSEPYPITSLLFARADGGTLRAIDAAQTDDCHPIPSLDVIDINAIKRSGGADQGIVIATPLDASARSVFRLFTKIDGYLNYIASDEFRSECGLPSAETTSVVVHIHPDSSRDIFQLLQDVAPSIQRRNARLDVRARPG